MPDDDGHPDDLDDLAEDLEATYVLMGWDGDPCECRACTCPNFRDGARDARCPDCREGRHWPAIGGGT